MSLTARFASIVALYYLLRSLKAVPAKATLLDLTRGFPRGSRRALPKALDLGIYSTVENDCRDKGIRRPRAPLGGTGQASGNQPRRLALLRAPGTASAGAAFAERLQAIPSAGSRSRAVSASRAGDRLHGGRAQRDSLSPRSRAGAMPPSALAGHAKGQGVG